jgi:type II secretory pathway pseudopilin PulG
MGTMNRENGISLVEVCLALLLVGCLSVFVIPAVATWIDSARLAAAGGRVTLLFRQLRYRAIASAHCRGVIFDRDDSGVWVYRVVADGNDNGIRRAEVADGTDPLLAGPVSLPAVHGGVRFGILDTGPVPVLPPGSGTIDDPSDPIRFGGSDLASFTPRGTCSSGTVYLLSPRGRMRAVRLYGATGRIRVFDYIPARETWVRR